MIFHPVGNQLTRQTNGEVFPRKKGREANGFRGSALSWTSVTSEPAVFQSPAMDVETSLRPTEPDGKNLAFLASLALAVWEVASRSVPWTDWKAAWIISIHHDYAIF